MNPILHGIYVWPARYRSLPDLDRGLGLCGSGRRLRGTRLMYRRLVAIRWSTRYGARRQVVRNVDFAILLGKVRHSRV